CSRAIWGRRASSCPSPTPPAARGAPASTSTSRPAPAATRAATPSSRRPSGARRPARTASPGPVWSTASTRPSARWRCRTPPGRGRRWRSNRCGRRCSGRSRSHEGGARRADREPVGRAPRDIARRRPGCRPREHSGPREPPAPPAARPGRELAAVPARRARPDLLPDLQLRADVRRADRVQGFHRHQGDHRQPLGRVRELRTLLRLVLLLAAAAQHPGAQPLPDAAVPAADHPRARAERAAQQVLQTVLPDAKVDGPYRLPLNSFAIAPAIMPSVVFPFMLDFVGVIYVGFGRALLMRNVLNVSRTDIIPTFVYESGRLQGQYSSAASVGL